MYTSTGSLWSAIVLHAHCNYFGFPNFGIILDERVYMLRRLLIMVMYMIGVLLFVIVI